MITFEMSYKIASTSWVQLAFSGIVIAGIVRFHSSLREVILVQLLLMTILLVFVAFSFLIDLVHSPKEPRTTAATRRIRLVRRISEDQVIAEFLKGDFHAPAFKKYQASLNEVVRNPHLENAGENAQRRALLFIRHLALCKEIPTETEWYEVEITQADVGQIRVFPRAQWRKLARGNFSITAVAEGLQTRQHLVDTPFLTKIADIGDQLLSEEPGLSAVILIGLNDNEPLTVLDGNHRLAAAMFASPNRLEKLRFLCGLSPRMSECCWYNTNLVTLFRYARNMLALASRNPANELARLLEGLDNGDARADAAPGGDHTLLDEVDDGPF